MKIFVKSLEKFLENNNNLTMIDIVISIVGFGEKN